MSTSKQFLQRGDRAALKRDMSVLETWGFGLSGHITWFSTIPLIVAALGPFSLLVLLPAVLIGILLNLQLKQLGEHWINVAGGTPNYAARLLNRYSACGSYAAIGYWFAWVSLLPINAIVLTDLIESNLEQLGLSSPHLLLKIGFTILPYILALSGSRALAILHLFFVIPAIGFTLLFVLQGLSWLAFAPESPGLLPIDRWHNWALPSLTDWTRWLFFALWITTACETATSFVADSKNPKKTLQFLPVTAALIPIVVLGTAWILACLATDLRSDTSIFEIVLTAAKPFWKGYASPFVTLLLTSACLLTSATSVANTPRILYQLARDRRLPPLFTFVSRRGVLGPNLIIALLVSLSLVGLNISQTVIVTGVGWLLCMLTLFVGVWLRRRRFTLCWSQGWLLSIAILAIVISIGGWAWGARELLTGLVTPALFLAAMTYLDRLPFAPLQLNWWIQHDRPRNQRLTQDFVAVQVVVLLVLVCSAATVSWLIKAALDGAAGAINNDLFVVVLMTVAFVAIAVACWTSLPQVAAIYEARQQAETRLLAALDTVPDAVFVLDAEGIIRQANPEAIALFNPLMPTLVGQHLSQFVTKLNGRPAIWPNRSEHTLMLPADPPVRIVEATISDRIERESPEYIVILRDISDRKQLEETLRNQAAQLQAALDGLHQMQTQLIQTEKMSSLGQLVAGVAHEVNNPINFIHGNLEYASNYAQDLLKLLQQYQKYYPHPIAELQQQLEEIDLDFIASDLPALLASMKVGTKRIREIVLSLRNFSRLDESETKTVDIHEGIDSTLLILQHRLKAKAKRPSIQVIKNYGDLPEIECYPGQLNQVFMNILSNAIDAIEQHHAAKHQSGTLTISTAKQVDRVVIQIADDGAGMTEAVQSKLFDPFFTTKPIGQGTGLGLSISYQIVVKQHNGKLYCNSKLGAGTEFVVEIPFKQSATARPVAAITV